MDFSTSTIIDWKLGIELIGSYETAKEMMTDLVAEIPVFQEKLIIAFQEKKLETLYTLAHTLHGLTCYCGTPRLKEISATLEKAILSQASQAVITDYYEKMLQEMAAVIEAFAFEQNGEGAIAKAK